MHKKYDWHKKAGVDITAKNADLNTEHRRDKGKHVTEVGLLQRYML